MAKKTIHPPHAVIASEAGLEAALHRYIEVALTLVRRKALQEKAISALQLAHDQANAQAEAEVLGLEAGIQIYCTEHRAALFPEGGRKSREYGDAIVGFRLNPPAVQKRFSKEPWERIALRLDAMEWGRAFVEKRLSVNREELLKRRAELSEAQLVAAGVAFAQGETFFLEPKSELLDAARKPAVSEAAA